MTSIPGVYRSPTSFAITGALTLDAQGDPDAVFIFQAGSTLITSTNSGVTLANGAQACNVFWQVGSSSTLGVGSRFVGTILALTSISANTNATLLRRLLARNGATTLDSNTVTRPLCARPTTTTTTTVPTATTTTTAVPPTTVPASTGPATTTTTAPTAGSTITITDPATSASNSSAQTPGRGGGAGISRRSTSDPDAEGARHSRARAHPYGGGFSSVRWRLPWAARWF